MPDPDAHFGLPQGFGRGRHPDPDGREIGFEDEHEDDAAMSGGFEGGCAHPDRASATDRDPDEASGVNAGVDGSDDRRAKSPGATREVVRDRILVLGRRSAGKSTFLIRLYEMMWEGRTLVDGRVISVDEHAQGDNVTRIDCRATTGTGHMNFMRAMSSMWNGSWPDATAGNSYSEIRVSYGGATHRLVTLDFPGEVFKKAFLQDSMDGDAAELRHAVDHAAGAILLVDPSVIAEGELDSHEDSFGLLQAALRIRESEGGSVVPIALVFTKIDVTGRFLREAGGTNAFARKHFRQLFSHAGQTAVYASTAVQQRLDALGRSVPDVDRTPHNVVEPLRYCLDRMRENARHRALLERREAAVRERERAATEARGRAAPLPDSAALAEDRGVGFRPIIVDEGAPVSATLSIVAFYSIVAIGVLSLIAFAVLALKGVIR